LATIRDGKVYSGESNFSGNILFTIDGSVTTEEFVAIWVAVTHLQNE